MSATGIWFGNEAWPGNRSCRQFAQDVFRLAGAVTDKQKALAFYDGLTRCMLRGPVLCLPGGAGGYARCFDPLPIFVSWGLGECTDWGWVAAECLNGAGLKTRRVVAHNNGHTFYEIWYRGDDGREQWHAFDPFGGWYFLNERGEVASCEELAADPALVQDPLPGHPVPLGHHPERNNQAHRHCVADQAFIDQPHRFEELSWALELGMEATFAFMPEAPDRALFTRHPGRGEPWADEYPDGAHCDISPDSRLGFRQCAAHYPYWKPYLRATPSKAHMNEGRPVRWHGAGALRWKPLLAGADAACDARRVVFENGQVRPAGRHDFGEVWYRFRLPFLASFVAVDYDVTGAAGDYWGLSLSADDRRTLWDLPLKSHAPHYGFTTNGQAQWKAGQPGVQGLREFWLRIDMMTHGAAPSLAVRALNVTVGFQHNMFLQPMLVPGRNPLWLEAAAIAPRAALAAEWIYQVRDMERRSALRLDAPGRVTETVAIEADTPSDIRVTGIRLALAAASRAPRQEGKRRT